MTTEPDWLNPCEPTDPLLIQNLQQHAAKQAAIYEAAPLLLQALHEGRRAIGDHFAPHDCYATGPLTGDHYRDLVECPACSFIAIYDIAIAKAKGRTP
jgi:hypothetical protein